MGTPVAHANHVSPWNHRTPRSWSLPDPREKHKRNPTTEIEPPWRANPPSRSKLRGRSGMQHPQMCNLPPEHNRIAVRGRAIGGAPSAPHPPRVGEDIAPMKTGRTSLRGRTGRLHRRDAQLKRVGLESEGPTSLRATRAEAARDPTRGLANVEQRSHRIGFGDSGEAQSGPSLGRKGSGRDSANA